FHKKAWGHAWPHHSDIVRATEIGQLGEDDELYFDGGVTEQFSYVCLDGIKEIASLLHILFHPDSFQDVIIIRREYEYLRETLESVPEKTFLLIGHPGIGKTSFLIYLLLYRLEHKLPTAVQFGDYEYIIFDRHGASVHNIHHVWNKRLKKCWALCDSNLYNIQPCWALQVNAERVILAASPKPERWKEWSEQTASTRIVVDLPTVMEIAAVLKELKLDTSKTLGHVGQWGPSIRSVLAVMKDPRPGPREIKRRQYAAQAAAKALIRHLSSFSFQSEISDIVFHRPHREPAQTNFYESPEHCISFIPTKYLSQTLDEYLNVLTTQDILALVYMLSSDWLMGTSASWMHQKMINGGTPIDLFRGQATMSMQRATRLLLGTAGGLKSARVTEPFYWMRSVMSLSGVDGVLGNTGHTKNNVFCLQATTTGDPRDPTEGIKKVWQTMSEEFRVNGIWHFVLVCDNHLQAQSLVDDFAQRLTGFTIGRTTCYCTGAGLCITSLIFCSSAPLRL
ncbi:hypothetical protein BDZ89DRAFT_941352, partial [Hymenopellis radicata]